MSDTTANLFRKINSAKDLQSVVRIMKAVAASSIGQYEKSVRALADYSRTVELGLNVCFRESLMVEEKNQTTVDTIGVVVFGSDQGLVGSFNDVVVDYTVQTLGDRLDTSQIWAVGERVYSRLKDLGLPLVGLLTVPNSVQTITPFIGQILLEREIQNTKSEITEFHLFYNRPVVGGLYEPFTQQLLPLDENWLHKIDKIPWPTENLPEIMGEKIDILRAFIREYLFVSLFRACAESLSSENASRLAAMQRADKNINELLENFNGEFNRLRQNSIDEELFDVISGFEAVEK